MCKWTAVKALMCRTADPSEGVSGKTQPGLLVSILIQRGEFSAMIHGQLYIRMQRIRYLWSVLFSA